MAPFLGVENEKNNGHVTKLENVKEPCRKGARWFRGWGKSQKGGRKGFSARLSWRRANRPKPRTGPPSQGWELRSELRLLWLWLWRQVALLSSCSLLLQHFQCPVPGMNPMNWGEEATARVWPPYLDALASLPVSLPSEMQVPNYIRRTP